VVRSPGPGPLAWTHGGDRWELEHGRVVERLETFVMIVLGESIVVSCAWRGRCRAGASPPPCSGWR
jgi:low temperature requirement protein LtrA